MSVTKQTCQIIINVHVVVIILYWKLPRGTFEICPVCFWEDDNIQFNAPSYAGGANEESSIQARENYLKFGASSKSYIKKVRKPFPQERSIP